MQFCKPNISVWKSFVQDSVKILDKKISPFLLIKSEWKWMKWQVPFCAQRFLTNQTFIFNVFSWKPRFSTADIIVKLACFVTKLNNILALKWAKLVGTRSSTVLSIPFSYTSMFFLHNLPLIPRGGWIWTLTLFISTCLLCHCAADAGKLLKLLPNNLAYHFKA